MVNQWINYKTYTRMCYVIENLSCKLPTYSNSLNSKVFKITYAYCKINYFYDRYLKHSYYKRVSRYCAIILHYIA